MPRAIRWPGVIKPGTVLNDIFAHEDMLPTLLAAAGVPDVKEQLLKGMKVGDKTFKVHLDGYNITDALAGKAPSPRQEFFYFNDDGSLVGAALRPVEDRLRRAARARLRRLAGAVRDAARCPSSSTSAPTRSRRPTTRAWTTSAGGSSTSSCSCRRSSTSGKFLATFKEFPPSQKAGSFSLDRVLVAPAAGEGLAALMPEYVSWRGTEAVRLWRRGYAESYVESYVEAGKLPRCCAVSRLTICAPNWWRRIERSASIHPYLCSAATQRFPCSVSVFLICWCTMSPWSYFHRTSARP